MMRSLSFEQIILLLVFIVVPVFNLILRGLQRWARGQRETVPVAREERPRFATPTPVWPVEPAFPGATPPRATPPREAAPRPRAETRKRPPGRTSARVRTAPLRGRAAVRRAIVAMAILGPCPGLELPAPQPRPPALPGVH
jgi:hypothetical protein